MCMKKHTPATLLCLPLYVLLYFGLCNGAVMCEVDRLVFMSVFKYIAFLVSAYFLDP